MKKIIIFFAIFGILVVAYAYYQKNPMLMRFSSFLPATQTHPSNGPQVTIDNQTFSLYVARTPQQQQKGLAIVTSLPVNQGMVFPFDHADYYAFWMKDMKFPIDIIYLNNNRIVTIFPNMQPAKSYTTTWQIVRPVSPADLVIEINAGLSQKYHFKVGDTAQISL